MSPLGSKMINRAPLTPFEVAIVTVSVGLPGVHDRDVVNEASGAVGAVVDVGGVVVDDAVVVVDVEVVVVVDVEVVVEVGVEVVVVVDVEVVVVVDEVVVGPPAIATLPETTAHASMPINASPAW